MRKKSERKKSKDSRSTKSRARAKRVVGRRTKPPPLLPLKRLFVAAAMNDDPNTLVGIDTKDFLFGFEMSAIHNHLIDAGWTDTITSRRISQRKVLLRSTRGLWLLRRNGLGNALAALQTIPVMRINHGLFVNLHAIDVLDFEARRKRIGFIIRGPGDQSRTEWLLVSHAVAKKILERLRP